ncbi:hypothetical protein AAC387_Pa01g2251 [Persea americana]
MAIPAETQFHALAVDDSLIDRKLIERLLITSSYQVTAVDSGSKALEFLGIHDEQGTSPSGSSESQETEVNLIIRDYCMLGMTGYDLLRKIKVQKKLRMRIEARGKYLWVILEKAQKSLSFDGNSLGSLEATIRIVRCHFLFLGDGSSCLNHLTT